MNQYSINPDPADTRPILIVPYMWIGDFVRGHTVVRVLNQRWPNRPVDLLATSLCAPLARLRHRTGAATHLEVGNCPRFGRDPGAGGLFWRSPVRADQPDALE